MWSKYTPCRRSDWRVIVSLIHNAIQAALAIELMLEFIKWDSKYCLAKCRVCRKSSDAGNMLLCDK